MKDLGVHIKRSRPRHPQSNGRVERLNRTIQSMVYRSADQLDHSAVEDTLLYVQMKYKYESKLFSVTVSIAFSQKQSCSFISLLSMSNNEQRGHMGSYLTVSINTVNGFHPVSGFLYNCIDNAVLRYFDFIRIDGKTL